MMQGLRSSLQTGNRSVMTITARLAVYILGVEFRLCGSQDVIVPSIEVVMISQVLSNDVVIFDPKLQASIVEQRSIRAMTRMMVGALSLR